MSTTSINTDPVHLQLLLARCEHSLACWLDMVVDLTLPTWYMKLYAYKLVHECQDAFRSVGDGNVHSLQVGERTVRVMQWIVMRTPRVSWHDFLVHRLLRDLPMDSIPTVLPDADGEHREHDWKDEELTDESLVPPQVWELPMPLIFADPVLTGDSSMPTLTFLPEADIPTELRLRHARVGLPPHLRNIEVEVVMPPPGVQANHATGELTQPSCDRCVGANAYPCVRKAEGAACYRCRKRKQPCSLSDGRPGRRRISDPTS